MSQIWYLVVGYYYFVSGIWIWDMGIETQKNAKPKACRPKGYGACDCLWADKRMNKKENILIVDDEPDMCWALSRILDRTDCCAQKAFNGKQALQMISEKHFSIAFLDAKLPDFEGLELAGRIRQKDACVRIFIVSGYFYKNDQEVQQALTQGLIAGFIAKPFDHEEIRLAIHNCLSSA